MRVCVCVCVQLGREHLFFQRSSRKILQLQKHCYEYYSRERSAFYLFTAVLGLLSCYLSNMWVVSCSYKYPLEEGEKVILIHIGKNKRAFGGACLHQ